MDRLLPREDSLQGLSRSIPHRHHSRSRTGKRTSKELM